MDQKDQTLDIEVLKQQAEEYLAGWKRAKADLVNYESQIARERGDWVRFAAVRVLERLLPIADTLHAALEHAPANDWTKGTRDAVRKLDDFLKSEGVAEIPAEGEYDHACHEVIGRQKKEGVAPGHIIHVAQRGYMLHDKVLRPAKVIVAE